MSDDTIAIITGGASGIGKGLAQEARQRGFKVYLVDIAAESLRSTARELGGDTEYRVLDVRDHAAMERFAEEVYELDGRVDLLFNNAGILRGGFSWTIGTRGWEDSFGVNVMGEVNGITSIGRRMVESGLSGRIANTASIGGLVSAPLIAPYAASKSAVIALTEALEVELQITRSPIRAHVIAPGPVRTAIYASAPRTGHAGNDAALAQMQGFTEQTGTDPAEFARFVFEGIESEQFWIISHPELWESALEASTQRIMGRVRPQPAHFSFDPRG